MGKTTGIGWTNHTFNPWWICTEVSPGCDNCYAREFAARFGFQWGKGVPRREFGDKHWNEPLAWNRIAEREQVPHLVFCASMADVMDIEAPAGARARLWELIDATPWLIWQLLTKRPTLYKRYLPKGFKHGNVWLGMTAEDQFAYDARWYPTFLAARDRDLPWYVSYEPALGPVRYRCDLCDAGALHSPDACDIPDWVIFGGESGDRRRLCDVEWAYAALQDARRYKVPFFMKQMSARTPEEGKKLIPADLLIHEFPSSYAERICGQGTYQ